MKARIMIENAPLGPDDLKLARDAFDGAWAAIAGRYSTPAGVEAAREQLARIILSLVPDTKDATEIQAIVVQEMTKGG